MISTLTGLVYPLRLIIAEAPDKRKRFRQGIAYAVIDATSPETQDKYHGYSPKADSAGHRKAIQDALDDFGSGFEQATGVGAGRRLMPGISRLDVSLPSWIIASEALEQSASFGGIAIGRLNSRLTAPHPGMQDRRHTASPWYRVTWSTVTT